MSQIRTELGISGQAPFSLQTATTGGYVAINNCSVPHPTPPEPQTLSEWYGYNHAAPCGTQFCMGFSTTSCTDACNNI